MGQNSSNPTGGSTPSAHKKTCYYELLSLPRDCTSDEIRKSYRRLALLLHPDRNHGAADPEAVTERFALVQAAYEVLSDPQERAWYDSHRDQILSGKTPGSGDGGSGGGAPPGTTDAETVMSWFGGLGAAGKMKMDDGPEGFFGRVRSAFMQLAREEVEAIQELGEEDDVSESELYARYPGFGGARDRYEGVPGNNVRDFYAVWSNFGSRKHFAWADLYRLSDAPDRQVRRMMERDNLKAREQARREFNDAVQNFVKFVRRRDPRYTPNTMNEKERAEEARKKSREQAMRQRRENAERLRRDREERGEVKVPDWTRVAEQELEDIWSGGSDDEGVAMQKQKGGDEGAGEGEGEEAEEDEEEEVPDRWECVVCHKTFRSQGQMDAHEKSKKHVKAVQQLKRQMQKENKALNLDKEVENLGSKISGYTLMDDEDDEEAPIPISSPVPELESTEPELDEQVDEELEAVSLPKPTPTPASKDASENDNDDEDEEDDTYASRASVEARILGNAPDISTSTSVSIHASDDEAPIKKKGAKYKRAMRAEAAAKKAAATAAAEAESSGHTCTGCSAGFPSKTKLFDHLKKNPKHAKLIPVSEGAGGKKKKGKR